MFKRIFWVGVGVAIGIVAVTKAQAYVKANTPDAARQFLLGPDQDNVPMKTLEGLVNEFNATRRAREAELNRQYIEQTNPHNPVFSTNTRRNCAHYPNKEFIRSCALRTSQSDTSIILPSTTISSCPRHP
jgi:hypothetical protein